MPSPLLKSRGSWTCLLILLFHRYTLLWTIICHWSEDIRDTSEHFMFMFNPHTSYLSTYNIAIAMIKPQLFRDKIEGKTCNHYVARFTLQHCAPKIYAAPIRIAIKSNWTCVKRFLKSTMNSQNPALSTYICHGVHHLSIVITAVVNTENYDVFLAATLSVMIELAKSNMWYVKWSQCIDLTRKKKKGFDYFMSMHANLSIWI